MESIMNKTMQAKVKRAYTTPRVEQVKLDTEISLVMTSDPGQFGDPEAPAIPPTFIQKLFKI
jgi:hypothetical protein